MKTRIIAKAQKRKKRNKQSYAQARGAPFKGQGDIQTEFGTNPYMDVAEIIALQRFLRRRSVKKVDKEGVDNGPARDIS